MSAARDRRRKYLVDKRFQIRYVALVILVLVLCIVIGVALASVGLKSMVGPTGMSSVERLSKVNFVFWIILLIVLGLLVAVGFYGVRMSHRIAGPIYAFNRHLNLLRQGIYYHDIRLRKTDELKSLAASFNAALSALRARVDAEVAELKEIQRTLNDLAEILSKEPATSSEAAKLKELIDRIQRLIDELQSRVERPQEEEE